MNVLFSARYLSLVPGDSGSKVYYKVVLPSRTINLIKKKKKKNFPWGDGGGVGSTGID